MKANPQNLLFTPLQIGNVTLPNRIVMAPLTRMRAKTPGNIPWELNTEYYRQRASAGLIITEATQISPQGQGYPATPGIYSEEQVAGWRNVVNAVHEKNGLIFLLGFPTSGGRSKARGFPPLIG
jgi:N-ethylmaleimide reductase